VSTIVWRFTDGKPGHDIQSLGLAQALQAQADVSVFNVPLRNRYIGFWSWLFCRYGCGAKLPVPDLLIGAGHATHWHMLAARRRWGGRIIVLMKPSLPLSWFDLCLVPEHDSPPPRANVLPTIGVLNNIRKSSAHDADTGLIVVGGPSRHYQWDDQALMDQLEQLVSARPVKKWILTTSRRTPRSLVSRLQQRPEFECVPFAATGGDWLAERLAEAGEVWVSEDSVSMIYEALASGARVGLLKVLRSGSNRVTSGVDALLDKGWLKAPGCWELPDVSAVSLNEASRCAEWIKQQWLADR